MFYAISYDIPDDRRRLRIAKILKDFGERVQFSVFEANIQQDQLQRLKQRLKEVVEPDEDRLRIYPLCASCAGNIEVLGQGEITQDPDFIVI